jgi:TDG/mug DNA glycosylase family protein
MSEVLPDVLDFNLKIVFCGMAVENRSAQRSAYFAGVGNKFWRTLFEVGLTPNKLDPSEFKKLNAFGIGLTDLIKTEFGNDDAVNSKFQDIQNLRSKIQTFQPRILAFNGKKSAEFFLGHKVDYGFQKEKMSDTKIYVLPSTSSAANGSWDESYWREIGKLAK